MLGILKQQKTFFFKNFSFRISFHRVVAWLNHIGKDQLPRYRGIFRTLLNIYDEDKSR